MLCQLPYSRCSEQQAYEELALPLAWVAQARVLAQLLEADSEVQESRTRLSVAIDLSE